MTEADTGTIPNPQLPVRRIPANLAAVNRAHAKYRRKMNVDASDT